MLFLYQTNSYSSICGRKLVQSRTLPNATKLSPGYTSYRRLRARAGSCCVSPVEPASLVLYARPVYRGGIVQKTIIFSGTIIGEGQRVECEVRATKITLDGDPPVFSDYRIMESDLTDRLPDGNYELLVNRDRTRFSRDAGRFFSRPY